MQNDMLLVTSFTCLVISMFAAFAKNRNMVAWALAGFFLPIISVIALYGLPPLGVDQQDAY